MMMRFVIKLYSLFIVPLIAVVYQYSISPKEDIYPIITSLMRFNAYFTIRKILRRLDGNEKMLNISAEFSADEIQKNGGHIRRRIIYHNRERKIKGMFPWETYDSINNRGSPYIAKFNKEPQCKR